MGSPVRSARVTRPELRNTRQRLAAGPAAAAPSVGGSGVEVAAGAAEEVDAADTAAGGAADRGTEQEDEDGDTPRAQEDPTG